MWGVGLLYLGTGVKLASFNHLGSLYNGIVDKLGSFNAGKFQHAYATGERRVFRDGSWYCGKVYLRVANRCKKQSYDPDSNGGFRCVVSEFKLKFCTTLIIGQILYVFTCI